ARPGNCAETLEVLKLAIKAGWRVTPLGNSNWPGTRSPIPDHTLLMSTQRLSHILEHEPADLISIVEPGVSFSDLNSHLATSRQWLPLDPPLCNSSTVGGITATGLSGSLEFGFGTPRSYVIGMHIALANGDVIKAGGRVVKNVAGYDLCKLFTGSFGSLGLILDVTFKLRPVPESFETLYFLNDSTEHLFQTADKVLASQLEPAALEIISASLLKQIGIEGQKADNCLLARFIGHEKSVKQQTEKMLSLLPGSMRYNGRYNEDEKALWSNLIDASSTNTFNRKLKLLPSRLSSTISALQNRLKSGSSWHASVGTGKLRIADPHDFLRPNNLSDAVIGLNVEIKKQFDPEGVFPIHPQITQMNTDK
ncbi:MAG: FAD-binding oxidoreductase, partial [Pyrinomonadaceae bacterium]